MSTLRYGFLGLVGALCLLVGCAGERLHREGLTAIDHGDYQAGLEKLQEAALADPHNMAYRLDLETRRDAVVQQLLAQADTARNAGQYAAAAQLYRQALSINPNNNRAQRGLAAIDGDARHAELIGSARKDFEHRDLESAESKVRSVLSEDPGYAPARDLSASINMARGPITVAPRLRTRDNRKVTLQLRDAPTKMVFEVLARQTGINFILDKDVKSDGKTTIFVQDVPVEEAIDLVLNQNSLSRQILAANMVLIYPNSATKQKEYEEQIVRSFYLTNAAPKDVENMLKTVLGVKTLFVDERSAMVVMRDTPDAVRMAEKLVASLDVPESEVMLELEVLEISRTKLQDLGINYPTQATLGVTAQGSAVGTTGLVLSDLSRQNSHTITVTPLSVTLQAMKQTGIANTLASPRIRARNNEKAKVLIGSRVPVITNTVTPTAGGTAVVTGAVQYLDVGLSLEAQPTIHMDSDVAIKLNFEVSTILEKVTTPQGTVAYRIGTRTANTVLRLRDGETQILAGLIQDSDSRSSNSIPGLGDIPVIGKLFGEHHTDVERDEIVLSVTPHIVRLQPRPASENTEFWYGTETRTRSAPYSSDGGSPRAPAAAGGAPVDLSNLPTGPEAEGTPAPVPTAPILHNMPVSAPPAAVSAPPTGDATAPARPALTIDGPNEVRVGDEFQVSVHLASAQPLTRLRSQLRFDSTALELVSASAGGVVPAAAGNPNVDARSGGAQLDVVATPDDPVHGEGDLMVLRFKALRARPAVNVAAMLSVIGSSGGATGNSAATPLSIAIRQ